ncbi:MAG: flagellar export chaperone FliS [Desulfovibrionales bacterium]
MHRAAQAYVNTKITTTTPGELVVLLYEGAVSALQKAKEEIKKKDYAQKGLQISRAMDLIAELDSSLNGQKGGELAQNLHQLYFYCNSRLLKANMDMDPEIIDQVISILSSLQSAFSEIASPSAAPPEGRSATGS